MAITNNIKIWGKDNDYGSSWYEISEDRIEGFKPNTINYASKMNQAFANATLLPYMFIEILKDAFGSTYTFTVDARSIPTTNYLSGLKTNLGNAINSYICSKAGKVNQASSADSSTNSTYASYIGTSSSHPSIGSSIVPVYVNNGVITQGSTYAGGTKITLNGIPKGATEATIYAPESAGTRGQILMSNGSGEPTWENSLAAKVNVNANVSTTIVENTVIDTRENSDTYMIIPSGIEPITITQTVRFGSKTGNKTKTYYGPVLIKATAYSSQYNPTLADSGDVGNEFYINGSKNTLDVSSENTEILLISKNEITVTSRLAYSYYKL